MRALRVYATESSTCDPPPRLRCASHGETPWLGHLVCSVCNRTWQTLAPAAPRYALADCACGERLLPDLADHARNFTARPICGSCFYVAGA